MIETTVTIGKSGKTLPNKFLGTLLTLIGSNKNSVNVRTQIFLILKTALILRDINRTKNLVIALSGE
jgi:hypothetical protein